MALFNGNGNGEKKPEWWQFVSHKFGPDSWAQYLQWGRAGNGLEAHIVAVKGKPSLTNQWDGPYVRHPADPCLNLALCDDGLGLRISYRFRSVKDLCPDCVAFIIAMSAAIEQEQKPVQGPHVAGEKIHFPQGEGYEVDKVERFGWKMLDKPGVFMEVDKQDILVDHEYQRSKIVWGRVNQIAKAWSWTAFGTITIAQRQDGNFYAVDGQHRKLASDKRSDIKKLPCMVFESESQAKEALDFVRLNSNRGAITAVAKHRAYITGGEKIANEIEAMLNRCGVTASENAANRADEIGCISRIRMSYGIDKAATEAALRVGISLARDEGISLKDRVFTALFYLHRNGLDILDIRFRTRVMQCGYSGVMKGISAATDLYGKTGGETWALGMLKIVNKSLRYKFEIPGNSGTMPIPKPDTEEKEE